ncbi:hypothetical protein ZWY2020_028767 [Hordeum vulgare]|nr:hypothetical protein ZWY2020_028767 [Hordeum vulgare]
MIDETAPQSVYGDSEWYFFSPRDSKYTNGIRPNRHGPAIGRPPTDKPIHDATGRCRPRRLVFYKGRCPKGTKTAWIMHEYRRHRPPAVVNTYRPIKFRNVSMRGRKKEGAKIMDPQFLIVIDVEAHDTASKAHLRNTEQNPQLSTEDGISASTFPDYVAYESTDQMLPSSSIDLPTEDDEPERVNETEQCNIGERLSSSRKWEETAGRLEEPEENTRGGSDNHAPFVWLEAWPPFPFSILSRFPPRVTQHNGLLWRG